MNVEIGTVAAQVLFWEYLFQIFGIVSLQCNTVTKNVDSDLCSYYMILFEWDAPEGNPGKCAYTCMLSYSIVVSHLSFNFLRLLLLSSIYLRVCTVLLIGMRAKPTTPSLTTVASTARTVNPTIPNSNSNSSRGPRHRPPRPGPTTASTADRRTTTRSPGVEPRAAADTSSD
jgi:hypothetical protein